MTNIETLTDRELIDQLAVRHDELIVIRPMRKARKGDVLVFTKTPSRDGRAYDLFEATEMLQTASLAIMRDSLMECPDD